MTHDELRDLWKQTKAREREMMRGGIFYRHYKGDTMQFLSLFLRESDLEVMVLYEHNGIFFARTLTDWEEMVEVDGQKVARFTKV